MVLSQDLQYENKHYKTEAVSIQELRIFFPIHEVAFFVSNLILYEFHHAM